ncbi:MAG: serine hydrolase [Verrucomicrobiales bacterium]|nr:serine hydrolase [Verrucomicrobiales bacterium]
MISSGLSAMTPEQVANVQKTVDQFSATQNQTGILLLVQDHGKTHTFTAGYAKPKLKEKIQSEHLFEIGSASKVFTGIAILQLIEQGKIALDTPIKKFYPTGAITQLANIKGENYWDQVTIGMLLNHTSGFIDYLNVYEDDEKAMQILAGQGKSYSFEQLIRLAIDHGDANFKPGNSFKYCNTGYIILGDIISKVSKTDWHDYIQNHILDAVGMPRTYFGSRIPQDILDSMPQGYFNGKASSMPPSLAGSAGEIISNLNDLEKFMLAWSTGKLYSKTETLANQLKDDMHLMSPLADNFFYGNAIMKIGDFYGHGGQTFGFQSFIAANQVTQQIFVVGTNDAAVNSLNLLTAVAALPIHKEQIGKQKAFQAPAPAPPLKLTDTAWQLTEVVQKTLPSAADLRTVNITFTKDGKTKGFSGCNSFNGGYTSKASSLKLGPLMSTRRACAGAAGELEILILQALDKVDGYSISDESQIMNLESKGAPILRFKRKP